MHGMRTLVLISCLGFLGFSHLALAADAQNVTSGPKPSPCGTSGSGNYCDVTFESPLPTPGSMMLGQTKTLKYCIKNTTQDPSPPYSGAQGNIQISGLTINDYTPSANSKITASPTQVGENDDDPCDGSTPDCPSDMILTPGQKCYVSFDFTMPDSTSSSTVTKGISVNFKRITGTGATPDQPLPAGNPAAVISTPVDANVITASINNAASTPVIYAYPGETTKGKVTLSNTNGTDITFSNVHLDPPVPGASLTIGTCSGTCVDNVCSSVLSPGSSCYYEVSITPPSASVKNKKSNKSGKNDSSPGITSVATNVVFNVGSSNDASSMPLQIWEPENNYFLKVPENIAGFNGLGTSTNRFDAGIIANNGKIYVAANYSGLDISDDGGNTWKNYTAANGLTRTTYPAGMYVNNSNVYMVDGRGLDIISMSGGTISVESFPDICSVNTSCWAVHADNKNRLYITGGKGLLIAAMSGGTLGSSYLYTQGNSNLCGGNISRNLYVDDASGRVYVEGDGSSCGLSIAVMSGDTIALGSSFNTYLSGKYPGGIYVDSFGKVYYGTGWFGQEGILYIGSPGSDGSYTFNSSYNFGGVNTINNVYVDASGKIYATQIGGGLFISPGIGSSFVNYNVDINGLDKNSLAVDASGKIYVVNDSGVEISPGEGSSFVVHSGAGVFGEYNTGSMYVDASGIYVTWTGGAYISNNQNGSNGFTDYALTAFGVYPAAGKVYVATNTGLLIAAMSGGTLGSSYLYTHDNSNIGAGWVRDVYVDDAGIIYAGTEGGLSMAPGAGSSFQNYTGAGEPTDMIRTYNNNIYGDDYSGLAIAPMSGGTLGGPFFYYNNSNSGLGTPSTNNVNDFYINNVSGRIFAAIKQYGGGGLSISNPSNGGCFVTYTQSNSYLGDVVRSVYVDDVNVYVATDSGLSIAPLSGGTLGVPGSSYFSNYLIYGGAPSFVRGYNGNIYTIANNGVYYTRSSK